LLMVVSFHSLEDKLVTKWMRKIAKGREIDSFGNLEFDYKLLTRKFIAPDEKEIVENPRSRSGMLRVLKKM
jgi:16S rRNA (cytosine1402-N4)-methyltransferase